MKVNLKIILVGLITTLALTQAHAMRWYSPNTGRWFSRDPIGRLGGPNEYCFVGNNPRKFIDPDGRAPKNVACGGVCGAIIDDWVSDEIKAQKAGWDKWRKDNPGNGKIGDYITWANGNQRYKDPNFFKFNTGTSCGKKDSTAEVGCGFSVTLCGKCVRSAILGNIMYGLVGNYAGFSDQDLKTASDWKRKVGMDVDQYDEEAYKVGEDVNGAVDFCGKFNDLLQKTPSALYEGRSDGGYNDLSSCRACAEMTSANNHGGNEKPRWQP
jgi:uncharacterized protein RhaS with RHS repeats